MLSNVRLVLSHCKLHVVMGYDHLQTIIKRPILLDKLNSNILILMGTLWTRAMYNFSSQIQAIYFPRTKLSCSVNFPIFLYSIKVEIESVENHLISKMLLEIGLKEWWEWVLRFFSLLARACCLSNCFPRKCFLFHQWGQAELIYC